MNTRSRWKLRFENFEKAFGQLSGVVEIGQLSEIEKMALVQAFEFTFELAWKTLKDYLEEEGFQVDSPRSTIRQAFQSHYIRDGEIWMEALKWRNSTVHTYSSEILNDTVSFIMERFFPLLQEWHGRLRKEYES